MTDEELRELINNSNIDSDDRIILNNTINSNSREEELQNPSESVVTNTLDYTTTSENNEQNIEIPVDTAADTEIQTEEADDTDYKIPENPEQIDVKDSTIRFSSAIWFNKIQEQRVTLAGLGGIGSYVAFLLSRLNVLALYIYDNDIVDGTNLGGQLYSKNDVDKLKTEATYNRIMNYSNFRRMYEFNELYTTESQFSDIMICGFDNMESRKIFFNNWLTGVRGHCLTGADDERRKNCLFIDGRLAAEELQVFCIKGDDDYNIKLYNDKYLFSDSDADETVCSYKQTSFTANMIGSLITNLFVNFCANMCDPLIDRDVPFLTYYNAENMYLKTIS